MPLQREEELAFVMANLHLHLLVERSMLGSPAMYVSLRCVQFCTVRVRESEVKPS